MPVPGFNTDVQCEGATFHVQSEDGGEANPGLETLVYVGGQIVHKERRPGPDGPDGAGGEDTIRRQLERQHRDIVRRARHGEFAGPGRVSVADLLPEREPFDETLVRRLADVGAEPVEMTFERGGAPVGLFGRLAVHDSASGAPCAGAYVVARFVSREVPPATFWRGETGADGTADVGAALPVGVTGAVIFSVDGRPGRLRVDIGPAGRPAIGDRNR